MRRRDFNLAAVTVCCFVVLGVLAGPSFGLVNTSDHFGFNEVPANDPGWNFVGEMSNGTGVYLGDGWVLAPYHVYRPRAQDQDAYIILDQQYDEIPGTVQRIKYDANTDADLVMFRVNGDPELYPDTGSGPALVDIRPNSLSFGEQMATIIGTGFGRDGDLQTWNVGGQTYQGFNTSDTRVKQWGSNSLATYGPVTPPGGYGTTEALWSMFDISPSRPEETQPVDKDSGGAAFLKREGQWELAGMVIAMAAVEGYPHDELPLQTHAVYGAGAIYADLSAYYSQIAVIRLTPLPGDADWNGRVDLTDFALLRSTFGQSGTGMSTDFDSSGMVDEGDLDILIGNFGMVSGSGIFMPGGTPLLAATVAPEPTTVCFMLVAAPVLLRSRKRRKSK